MENKEKNKTVIENEDGTIIQAGKKQLADGTVVDIESGKELFIPRSKMLNEEYKERLNSLDKVQCKLVRQERKNGSISHFIRILIHEKVALPTKLTPKVVLEKRLDAITFDLYLAHLNATLTNPGTGLETYQFEAPFRISVGKNKNGNDCYIWDLFIAGKKYESDYLDSNALEYMQLKNFLPTVEERIYSDELESRPMIEF